MNVKELMNSLEKFIDCEKTKELQVKVLLADKTELDILDIILVKNCMDSTPYKEILIKTK